MYRDKGVLVVIGLVTFACGGSHPAASPDAELDSSVDAPPVLRTISGVFTRRHITPTGEVDVPANLSGATVSVLAEPSFTVYPGVANANGTFSIPNVPVGPYYLKLGSRYLELSADTVDLSFDLVGRAFVAGATAPTALTFDVANLSTWTSTDELQMMSPGNGTIAFAMQAAATAGAPGVGATSLAGFNYDLSHAASPALIDGSLGDQLTVTQLATQTTGTPARTYRTAARTFQPASFTVANGGTASLPGTFATVPASATLDVVWDRPAFETELAQRSPHQSERYTTFAVSALPEASTRGFYDSAPDVVVFAPGYSTDTTAVTANWAYGDPYPAAWSRIAWVRYESYRFVHLGTATPVAVFGALMTYRDLTTVTSASPIEPIVGAVVNPTVGGKDAFGTLTGIGLTPTVAWTAPTIGVVSRYYVSVVEVIDSAGSTALSPIGVVETSATQVVIPPGLLVAGHSYVFEIEARSAVGLDLSATPNAYVLPEGLGQVTSSVATP